MNIKKTKIIVSFYVTAAIIIICFTLNNVGFFEYQKNIFLTKKNILLKQRSYVIKNSNGNTIKVQGMINKKLQNGITIDYFYDTLEIVFDENTIFYSIDINKSEQNNISKIESDSLDFLEVGKYITVFCNLSRKNPKIPQAKIIYIWKEE